MSEQANDCAAMVWADTWHRYRCANRAKTTAVACWGSASGQSVPVCGVHARARNIDSDGPIHQTEGGVIRFKPGEVYLDPDDPDEPFKRYSGADS